MALLGKIQSCCLAVNIKDNSRPDSRKCESNFIGMIYLTI